MIRELYPNGKCENTRELYDLDKCENTRYYSESSGISSSCSSPNSRVFSPGSGIGSPGQIDYEYQLNASNTYFDHSQNMLNIESTFSQCYLNIVEQPTDKFRFRYKSEMHGTHGSLMGKKNEKSKKTYPSVELVGYPSNAIIRCSLYQTDITNPSPHSHRLVVRKDEKDIPDPHDLHVSKERGFTAQFQGMGIIHTAKKFIAEELCLKKMQLIKFETGKEAFSLKEKQQMKDQAEKEAKLMNLNQVRLCFEAFGMHENGILKKICSPVFSTPINNMKSALTGELKICRLSTAVSSANGGDDLFLLVEKVGKKNIKVRFYELYDDEVVWEAFGEFSEADVHHQYAIALRTPKYRNVDIDTSVDVYIQLIRPSDNDCSEPRLFKYKPRSTVTSRKRRRTSCTSSLSSLELPEPIAKGLRSVQPSEDGHLSISEEYDKNYHIQDLLNATSGQILDEQKFMTMVLNDSDKLIKMMDPSVLDNPITGSLEFDGAFHNKINKKPHSVNVPEINSNVYLNLIYKQLLKANGDEKILKTNILHIWNEFSNSNENGDDILHNIIFDNNINGCIKLFKIIERLQLHEIIQSQNSRGQTSLHFACLYDRSKFIRPLINNGCDANIQDVDGNTALHIAVEENFTNCVDSLLNKTNYNNTLSIPINVNLTNDDGYTPLHIAIRREQFSTVKVLIENGASSKISINKNGNNALHLAIESKNLEIVQYLLDNTNVKISERNLNGLNAVDLATSINPKSEILQTLLKSNGRDTHKPFPDIKLKKENLSYSSDDDTTDNNYNENKININSNDKTNDINDNDDNSDDDDDDDDNNDNHNHNDNDNDADDNDGDGKNELKIEEDRDEMLNLSDQMIKDIATILDNNKIWEKIAVSLNLEIYLCLWSTSETMLRHLSSNNQFTKAQFIVALEENAINSADIINIKTRLNFIK